MKENPKSSPRAKVTQKQFVLDLIKSAKTLNHHTRKSNPNVVLDLNKPSPRAKVTIKSFLTQINEKT